jgi:hypothetical protein
LHGAGLGKWRAYLQSEGCESSPDFQKKTMSPLRQRMIDAMTLRGLSARTIECYTQAIARRSRHHGNTNPARLAPEQIEAYLLHLVQDRKLSYSRVNHAASACRFLFETQFR